MSKPLKYTLKGHKYCAVDPCGITYIEEQDKGTLIEYRAGDKVEVIEVLESFEKVFADWTAYELW